MVLRFRIHYMHISWVKPLEISRHFFLCAVGSRNASYNTSIDQGLLHIHLVYQTGFCFKRIFLLAVEVGDLENAERMYLW